MLVEQVLHERAAFLEGDNDAHPEQGAPGVLATAANTSMAMIHSLMPHSVTRRSNRPSLPSSLLVVRAATVTGLEIHSSVIGRSPVSPSASSWSALARLKLCQ